MKELFGGVYRDRKVLITGHTGFKGSWLTLWLSRLGAEVIGYALAPATMPSHSKLLNVDCLSIIGDLRDADTLQAVIKQEQPDIIFHLAAQALVRESYREPAETFSTNVMGIVSLLEICRKCANVEAVVIVTSDKCYENQEWMRGYHEADALGGHDPYSASKGCAEIVTASYRRSFFPVEKYGENHNTLLSTARAGNVIGGGDWAQDRLIPDIMKAANKSKTATIRSPNAARPWQHVLESLSGYLMLGQKLLEGKTAFAGPWNFGPREEENLKVGTVVQQLQRHWSKIDYRLSSQQDALHEADLLKLDCSKARIQLGWSPVWDIYQALEKTAEWYRHFYECREVLTNQQLSQYAHAAEQKNLEWTGHEDALLVKV